MARQILNYTPDLPDEHWAQIESFVRSAVADCMDRTPYRAAVLLHAVKAYVHWCWQTACVQLDRDLVFSRFQVEEFIVTTDASWTPVTKANIRSQLLRVCEVLGGPEAGVRLSPLPKSEPLAPYSRAEIIRFRAWAASQTTAAKREDLAALFGLGFGAGMSAGEVAEASPEDVTVDDHGVLVRVSGGPRSERFVPVLAEWESHVIDAVEQSAGRRYLFKPGRSMSTKNTVTDLFRRCSPVAPRLQSQRIRGTWIVGHLAARTPIVPLIEAAGVESLEALTRYLRFLPEIDPAEARTRLRRELDRSPEP